MKNLMIKILLIVFVVSNIQLKADEGMFLPMFIERLNHQDMTKAGLKLTAKEIYDVNNASLKDAIVSFSDFCTGEIISSKGLVLTNHHCGYGAIAGLSTPEDNILKNGFWAKNNREERPAPKMFVKFLDRMEDVTKEFKKVQKLSGKKRSKKVREISEKIKDRELKKYNNAKGISVVIKSFFKGNEYYMFIYKKYTDVRLVGTPPSSVGKYGSDTDNWMWPRHTGDFSMFRVYTDKNGNPADYSENNIPLKPKKHLKINLKGLQKNDYAMIMGYPGRTERYLPSFGVERVINVEYPEVVKLLGEKIEIIGRHMRKDEGVFIKYAGSRARFSNTWKNRDASIVALKKLKVANDKQKQEAEFTKWVKGNRKRNKEYGGVISNFKKVYSSNHEELRYALVYRYSLLSNSITRTISSFGREKLTKEKAMEISNKFWKDHNYDLERELFIKSTYRIVKEIKDLGKLPKKLQNVKKEDIEKMYDNSIYSSKANLEKAINDFKNTKFTEDALYEIVKESREILSNLYKEIGKGQEGIADSYRLYVKGLREMNPNKKYTPDANFTMRVTYGNILPYDPKDAVTYNYYTTIDGVMEKYKKGDWEFDLPKKLIDLYDNKDYGRYSDKNGYMPVCFISNNDITGGNSGSPVLNSKGELIGTAFDGNYDAMSGDIKFDDNLQRTISCDIRYVLFIVEKLGGAKNIISELDIVE